MINSCSINLNNSNIIYIIIFLAYFKIKYILKSPDCPVEIKTMFFGYIMFSAPARSNNLLLSEGDNRSTVNV